MTKRKKDPLSFLFFQTGYFQAWMISTLQRTRTHPLLLSEVQDFLLCLLLFHPLIMGENRPLRLLILIIINLFLLSTFFWIIPKHFVIKKESPGERAAKKRPDQDDLRISRQEDPLQRKDGYYLSVLYGVIF